MATLKLHTNDNNYIWITDVKRVEELCYFYPSENVSETPWGALDRALLGLKENNPTLHERISNWMASYPNYSSCLTTVPAMIFINVVFAEDPDNSQNWIVAKGQNFLLENGKTVDRF